jgi:hypothetical protein
MFDINKIIEEIQKGIFNDNLANSKASTLQSILDAKIEAQRSALGIGKFGMDYSANKDASSLIATNSNYANGAVQGAAAGSMQTMYGQVGSIDPKKLEGDKRFPPEFLNKVREVCQELSIKFDHLMVAMSFETGGTFSPSARNRQSGATGLIQFMPSTAKGLGTTTEKLAQMTQVEQMTYVKKYLSSKNLAGKDFSDIYMSILFPVAVGKPADFVLFGTGAIKGFTGKAYAQNKGLDLNKNGAITKAEAAAQAWKNGMAHFK